MIRALLLLHHLLAVFLLGALTHQGVAVLWPSTGGGPDTFPQALRRVVPSRYAGAVAVSFLVTAALGALIYPAFVLAVRAPFLDAAHPGAVGFFELKEHLTAVGLGLLPAYWWTWRAGGERARGLRAATTVLLAGIVWWDFLVGHVLVNLRGL